MTESLSKYSDPITATGSLITFDAPDGGLVDSIIVPISPTQDLHGYDNPWPAGGGKNLFDKDNPSVLNAYVGNTSITSSSSYRTVYIPCKPNTTYTASKIAVASGSSDRFTIAYTKEIPAGGVAVYDRHAKSSGFVIGEKVSLSTTTDADAKYVVVWVSRTTGTEYADSLPTLQIEVGATATNYAPYSNICPITGLTGLSVYVGPTQDPDDATEYPLAFSEVLAGSVDPVNGEIKKRPEYSSYNGEPLVGPWMSSMDAYAAGTTPTNGAQVVDLGGALTTVSITPVPILMRDGQNNVWADTGAVITLIYRLLEVERKIDRTSIGKKAESLDVLGKFSSISKVEVNVTENLFYEAGDSSGRTLTIDCPFGTQEMADNLLAMLEGFYYQPYEARKAILDPAFEIGDGVTVGNVYGGIFSIHQKCGPLHLADLSAPADEEIDHEYKFTPSSERKIERRLNNMESELSVQAGEISAKVDRQGGDPSSVSWLMDSDEWRVKVDGQDVLVVGENGLTVNGDGNFTGEVHAKNIRYGGSSGSFSGGGISGGSIGTSKFTSGINVSLGNADYSADVFSGAVVASWTKVQSLQVVGTFFLVGTMNKGGTKFDTVTKTVKDGSGNNITIHYLGY